MLTTLYLILFVLLYIAGAVFIGFPMGRWALWLERHSGHWGLRSWNIARYVSFLLFPLKTKRQCIPMLSHYELKGNYPECRRARLRYILRCGVIWLPRCVLNIFLIACVAIISLVRGALSLLVRVSKKSMSAVVDHIERTTPSHL